jgi:hypothetical protein
MSMQRYKEVVNDDEKHQQRLMSASEIHRHSLMNRALASADRRPSLIPKGHSAHPNEAAEMSATRQVSTQRRGSRAARTRAASASASRGKASFAAAAAAAAGAGNGDTANDDAGDAGEALPQGGHRRQERNAAIESLYSQRKGSLSRAKSAAPSTLRIGEPQFSRLNQTMLVKKGSGENDAAARNGNGNGDGDGGGGGILTSKVTTKDHWGAGAVEQKHHESEARHRQQKLDSLTTEIDRLTALANLHRNLSCDRLAQLLVLDVKCAEALRAWSAVMSFSGPFVYKGQAYGVAQDVYAFQTRQENKKMRLRAKASRDAHKAARQKPSKVHLSHAPPSSQSPYAQYARVPSRRGSGSALAGSMHGMFGR